ncbi:MAG: cytochrome c3 family protein [Selenomonas sp.]|uniref:cytochrome c3 family protein n=1 Tax=Selenomonas sp. TaxID=2053611 RepID=UPI0025D94C1E|nr:cytochrome c3 family protein [Selenomonas sp.]MCR5757474.1 cytochrome c3 family protein [Selenomonas sp.]
MKKWLRKIFQWMKGHPLGSLVVVFVLIVAGGAGMAQAEKIPQLACSPCHVMEPYVEGYHQGELLAQKHQQAGVACIDCHENGIEDKVKETVWYVTDDFDDPPAKRHFDNQMCTKCHTNLDEIVTKTDQGNGVNPHDSHLGDLTCSDCHRMHQKSKAACQDCHDFEFLKQLPPEWQKVKKIAE